ncbi:hypothetical protein J6590_093880 [Homalodisca vitripennis]|nr:hypothetical protein J6590_093880 [Homalodisca vitripennis]
MVPAEKEDQQNFSSRVSVRTILDELVYTVNPCNTREKQPTLHRLYTPQVIVLLMVLCSELAEQYQWRENLIAICFNESFSFDVSARHSEILPSLMRLFWP